MTTPVAGPDPQVYVKPAYTINEFCREFAVGRSSAYEEIRAGRLRAYKQGASTRIAGEDALAWRDANRCVRAT
jgi:excisionase family DNA binding protein